LSLTLPDGLVLPDEDGCPAPATLAPPPPAPRSAWVLAGVALAVRAAAALLDPVPPRDGIALAETVRAAAGGSFRALLEAPHPPLAALLAAPFAALGLDPVAALSVVAVFCGGAAAFALHAIARRMFDEDAANGAVLLYAVTPPLVRLGSTALGEPVLFLLGVLSVDAAVRALRHWRPARDAACAGLLGGAAFLARPEGLALLLPAVLAPLGPGGGRPRRNRVAGAALAALAFAAVAGPWAAASGRLLPGKSVAVLAGSGIPAEPGGAAPAERHGFFGAAVQAAGALPEAIHPVVAALAALGLAAAAAGFRPCGRAMGPLALVLGAAGLFLGGVVLLEWRYGYGGRRHAAMAAVLLVPFAGAGILAAGRLLGRVGGSLARPVVALGIVAFGAAIPLLVGAVFQRDEAGGEARKVGLRLRSLHGPGAPPLRVATFGEPRVAWYAGGTDARLLRDYGVPPGAPPGEGARKRAALLWMLRHEGAPEFLILRKGDGRVPPGLPDPRWDPPAAEAGSLRAWRTAGIR